jgi:hypothetical protein
MEYDDEINKIFLRMADIKSRILKNSTILKKLDGKVNSKNVEFLRRKLKKNNVELKIKLDVNKKKLFIFLNDINKKLIKKISDING